MNLVIRKTPKIEPNEIEFYKKIILELIKKKEKEPENDFAIIVDSKKELILEKEKQVFLTKNPLNHIVLKIIDKFSEKSRNNESEYYLLNNLDLLVFYEPCLMCSMGLTHSRIRRVIYIEFNYLRLGAMNQNFNVSKLKTNHKIQVFKFEQKTDEFSSFN